MGFDFKNPWIVCVHNTFKMILQFMVIILKVIVASPENLPVVCNLQQRFTFFRLRTSVLLLRNRLRSAL